MAQRSSILGRTGAESAFRAWMTGRDPARWDTDSTELDALLKPFGYARDPNTSRYFTTDRKSFVDVVGQGGYGWNLGADSRQTKRKGAMGAIAEKAAANVPAPPAPVNPHVDAYAKYQAANEAALKQRRTARGSGRHQLIGAGFSILGAPSVGRSALGGY